MVIPASEDPQVFYSDSEDDDSEDDDSEDYAEGDGPVDIVTADDSDEDESEDESEPIDPIILEARAKLEEAKESDEPITDPEIIRTLFGRCRG